MKEKLLLWVKAHPDTIAIAFVVTLLIIWIVQVYKRRPLKYKRVDAIVTAAERTFYFALQEAVGDRFYIFTKVRMADVLLPVSAEDRSRWRSAFNKVACKHFDYVLCDAELKIVLAVELDDVSHQRADRQERDKFVDWACKSAGFTLLRIAPQKKYDVARLRRRIYTIAGDKF